MKNQRFAMLLGIFNLVVLLFIAASPDHQDFEKIRVKEFEVIDKKGIMRAAIKVEPDGEVMLRLRDKTGTIRVKIGATEQGSSLVLLNNATEVGIHALAKNKESKFVVVGKDGKKTRIMKLEKLKYWLIPAFWIIVSILMLAQEYLYLSNQIRGLNFDWVSAIVFKFKWLLYIPITFLVFYIGKKLPIQKPQIVQRLLIHKAISLSVSILAVFLFALFLTLIFNFVGDKKTFSETFIKVLSTSFLNEFINYWLILAVYHGIKIFENYQQSIIEKAHLEKQLSETKLSALKIQLQPHFLFNTHHNIIGLMQKGDTEKATKMLIKLSDLLRLSLKENNEDLVKLKNEIHLLELYLDILKIRFEDRLSCKILIDNSLQEVFVPPMLLQPIVENAIKYGVEPFAKQGEIEISAKNTETQLMLSVKDNGIESFSNFKFGIGLMNTQERLKNLFGEETSINISSNAPDSGVCITITLPLLK